MPCQFIFRFWDHVQKLSCFGKNRRGKDRNRHVAGFMRCVNVHPCLEHVLWPYRACHKATAQLSTITKECSWNSKEICNGSKLGCRSNLVESHCQLLSRWNSFAHRSVLLGYVMFDFIQNNRKCIPCNTKGLIPLFTVKRTVSQYKPVLRIRPHPANSISWRVYQYYYRQHV